MQHLNVAFPRILAHVVSIPFASVALSLLSCSFKSSVLLTVPSAIQGSRFNSCIVAVTSGFGLVSELSTVVAITSGLVFLQLYGRHCHV
jgi:hypothetical protein